MNWPKDCVYFANSRGGSILIGIEDNDGQPPTNQKTDKEPPNRIRKRVAELTVNVATYPHSSISEIRHRIGTEIPTQKIKSQLARMLNDNGIIAEGVNRWRRYSINEKA